MEGVAISCQKRIGMTAAHNAVGERQANKRNRQKATQTNESAAATGSASSPDLTTTPR